MAVIAAFLVLIASFAISLWSRKRRRRRRPRPPLTIAHVTVTADRYARAADPMTLSLAVPQN